MPKLPILDYCCFARRFVISVGFLPYVGSCNYLPVVGPYIRCSDVGRSFPPRLGGTLVNGRSLRIDTTSAAIVANSLVLMKSCRQNFSLLFSSVPQGIQISLHTMALVIECMADCHTTWQID